ncbi:DNA (cytosine-5-)-methyltransferase [Myroides odoratimimus]|uniref:Cytosine-specific methyltransferase n=1 Tax=Myroides odoratimimus CIP 101113 TaxID=883154 RepID=A0AAV3EZD8_9FLAO|nr:DNA (cytosine-5-)-methyltransferase [Myroides odoratimimus]EHO06400.1 DNA (cytosine-5-)-methyltransferase [Myroides odoratimimus CIP 101113]SHM14327.1 DNA (cytosine-5)-methyltransferase 1 [Myroides odoratimimus subsp. xuanwuensis]
MNNIFSVGSLYAGIGGICLGFKNANFELAWANEYDKNACITYRKNFKHQLIEEDVFNVDIDSLSKVDVLAGGFPCQPFSIAGYRKGFDDHRGNHFFRILDFVDIIRPKVVFLENVKNLKTHDKGITFKVIENALRERNYSFQSAVLNTKDYGNIPHNRERIFIVAFDLSQLPCADFIFKFPNPLKRTVFIKDVLEKENIEDKYYYNVSNKHFKLLSQAINSLEEVYQLRRIYVRKNKSNVCPALTANMGTGGNNVPIIKTLQGIRKLTPRECFRLQGFNDSFIIGGVSDTQLYKQIGNSVSVSVIQRIAENIFKTLTY